MCNLAFCSKKKVILSESGENYAQIKHCLQVKTVQNKLVDFDVKKGIDKLWPDTYGLWTHILTRNNYLKFKRPSNGVV